MPVYKVNKEDNFTVVSNVHLRDRRLTLKAKGLMTMVLSLSDDWEYSISGLAAICKEGKSAVKSALKELKDYGYLTITKIPPTKGNASFDYLYEFYEKPLGTDSLGIENLGLEDLALENQPQLNKEIINKEIPKVKKQDEEKGKDEMSFELDRNGNPKHRCECGGMISRNKQLGVFECNSCFKKF